MTPKQTPDAERQESAHLDGYEFDELVSSGELCFDTPEEEVQFWEEMRDEV